MMEQCITCAQHSNVVVARLRPFAQQLGASLPLLLSSLASTIASGTNATSKVVEGFENVERESERLPFLVDLYWTARKHCLPWAWIP
jgi:hypothetical protein